MSQPLPMPLDVRLMNFAGVLLLTALALGCVAAGLWWVMRNPVFTIRGITLQGDTAHSSADSLRASVGPRLSGNFFTMDMQAAQAAFQSAPWVRAAQVRRVFPDRLEVTLREHVPAAFWGEGGGQMVDEQGLVFDTGGLAGDTGDLPRLSGPRDQAALVLAAFRALSAALAPAGLNPRALELTPRGGWRAELGNGGVLELGRGAPDDLAARARSFAATALLVAARHQRGPRDIESADLRYQAGYALRLRGLTTVAGGQPPAASASAPARHDHE
ncbi:MAG: cell division protein FtsQ/DivIB [Burkholderiaceae bacterium]|nr:cell division protein FtsQ/DivIB [Burkholderiaceae bacterium]